MHPSTTSDLCQSAAAFAARVAMLPAADRIRIACRMSAMYGGRDLAFNAFRALARGDSLPA